MAKSKRAGLRAARAVAASMREWVDALGRINEGIARMEAARAERAKLYPYQLGQRLAVPGHAGVQGVVTLPRFNDAARQRDVNAQQFYLTWVAADGAGADGWFTAAELRAANPTFADMMAATQAREAAARGARRARKAG